MLEKEKCVPLHFGVVAIKNGAFWSPSTMVANFTYLIRVQNLEAIVCILFDINTGRGGKIWNNFIRFF